MENLLRNEFIACHYKLNRSKFSFGKTEESIRKNIKAIEKHDCTELYIGITDCGTHLHIDTGTAKGTGKFTNPEGATVTIINYDRFFSSLPNEITRGKKRCDAILYTATRTNFLLNELKISGSRSANKTAKQQLMDSLEMLLTVPEIKYFIDAFVVKNCCRFTLKPPEAPVGINAVASFDRFNNLSNKPNHLSCPDIEKFGFELYDCHLPTQSYELVQCSVK